MVSSLNITFQHIGQSLVSGHLYLVNNMSIKYDGRYNLIKLLYQIVSSFSASNLSDPINKMYY